MMRRGGFRSVRLTLAILLGMTAAAMTAAAANDEPAGAPAATTEDGARSAAAPVQPVARTRATARLKANGPRGGQLTFDLDGPSDYTVVRDGPRVSILFEGVSDIDVGRLHGGGGGVSDIGVARGSRRTAFVMAIPKGAELSDRRAGNQVILEVTTAPTKGKRGARKAGHGTPAPAAMAAPPLHPDLPPAADAASVGAAAPMAAVGEPPSLAASATGIAAPAPPPPPTALATLRFAWPRPVAAAIFQRAGALWLVFDMPSSPSLDDLRAGAGPSVRAIRQLASPRATVLRLAIDDGVAPTISRDGTAWLVRLARGPLIASAAIVPRVDSEAGQVRLPVAEPGEPLAISDPEIGDTVVVVPTLPLGAGVPHAFRYPQFDLLPSAQGIALRPLIDTLAVRSERDGVRLTDGHGLRVTAVSEASRAAAAVPTLGEDEHVLALDRVAALTPAQFAGEQRRLRDLVIAAETPEQREAARLRLARFYLAHRFAAEALGVTQLILAERPAAEDEATIRLLRGAARTLMGRLAEAQGDLDHASLADKGEAGLWRTVRQVRGGEAPRELSDFDRLRALAQGYPPPLREPVLTALAEAAIASGRGDEAAGLLTLLRAATREAGALAWLDHLEGLLRESEGDESKALAAYDRAADGEQRLARMRAGAAATRLRLAKGEIDAARAITEYDRLRFTWRGDGDEVAVLHALGQVQAKAGDYPAALRSWRQAAALSRGRPEAAALTREMAAVFTALFEEGGIDQLPPVKALALYQEFKELAPLDERGDAIERKVAAIHLAADLPQPAIALMRAQTQRPLPAVDRALAGAIWAEAALHDNDAEQALAALAKSEAAGLPADLRQRRGRTQAEALARLGRYDEALGALTATPGDGDQRLRILRQKQDWAGLSAASEQRLRDLGATADSPLDDTQAAAVLDRAVALSLAHDTPRLAELAAQYAAAMARSPYRDTFAMLTASGEARDGNARDAAASVGAISGFRQALRAHDGTPATAPARP